MKNALSFRNRNDMFGFMPTFMTNWFDDFGMVPSNFTNSPKVNIKETDKAYEIEIANPGMTKNDVHVDVKDNTLYVNIDMETSEDDNSSEYKYHVHEWSKSSYQESWYLPKNVIQDEITAKSNDGVLVVTLPKKEEESKDTDSKTIEIK